MSSTSTPVTSVYLAPEEDQRHKALFGQEAAQPSVMIRLWRVFERRRWLILGSVVVIALLGLLYSLTRVPLYTSTAQIEISRESARVVDIQSVEGDASEFNLEFYQTQYGLLRSEALAQQVVRDMQLHDDEQFIAAYNLGADENSTSLELNLSPAQARQAAVRQAAEILLGAVEIAPIRSSSLVDISATTPDPVLSARIANAWGENFIDMNLRRRYEASSYAREFLESRLEELRQRLEESERELVSYAAAQNIVNLEQSVDTATGRTTAQRSIQADQLAALSEELARAEADALRLRASELL